MKNAGAILMALAAGASCVVAYPAVPANGAAPIQARVPHRFREYRSAPPGNSMLTRPPQLSPFEERTRRKPPPWPLRPPLPPATEQ
ncbi:hypothetical protein F4778DRAFT_505116 [Xylariomycetidae sp. FL2044]|nr:hypothetical protein F4778DRAFT_505116 [Xylariomycetidae sp. FL2044]